MRSTSRLLGRGDFGQWDERLDEQLAPVDLEQLRLSHPQRLVPRTDLEHIGPDR